jgi:hypothetical protein
MTRDAQKQSVKCSGRHDWIKTDLYDTDSNAGVTRIAGYRTMTGAQRYNARMDRLFDECKDAKTRFNASSRTETDDHDDGTCVHSTDTCPALAVAAVAPDAGEIWRENWSLGLDSDDERTQIITADGQHLCYVEQYPLAEITESIIRDHNTRRLLVAALESAYSVIKKYRQAFDDYSLFLGDDHKRFDKLITDALAAAKGGSE